MAIYIINMGSNLGDPRLNLSRGMRAVAQEFGDFEISHTVRSRSWGYESEHPFLNVAMMFRSDLEPPEVLRRLQEIEHLLSPESHRTADGGYADRVLDIDIVAVDDRVIDTPELKVPHPHLAERRFFLEPMAEIADGWRHPVTGLTPSGMLAKLPADDGE